jgi:hypothetical protein
MMKQKVKKMIDVSHATIQDIFYRKIKEMTIQSRENTFDIQFSDEFLISDDCLG